MENDKLRTVLNIIDDSIETHVRNQRDLKMWNPHNTNSVLSYCQIEQELKF